MSNQHPPFARQQPPVPEGHTAINIDHLIGMYIGIASIETPATEKRTKILDQFETVILNFTASISMGIQQ